jgi:hypothetical protein
VNRAELLHLNTDADIIVRGHVHDQHVRIRSVESITRRGTPRIIPKPKATVTACSFASDTGYAERKGYPPTDDGIIWLEVTNPRLRSAGNGAKEGGRIRRVEASF